MAASDSSFFDDLGSPRWLALWASMLGYLLDAMDVLLYIFAVQTLKTEFGFSNAMAGLVSSATLVASAAGGIASGILADRIGRRRTLMYTILVYSLASGGSAFSTGLWSLVFWRALVGLGLGGEWSAGAVLVAESWPAHHRAKAISFMQSGWALGYMLAAVVAAFILPRFGWRMLFLVGVLPSLLCLYIRRKVEEPAVWLKRTERASFWILFRPPLARRTFIATAMATSVLFAYWGLFTWLPGFLSAPVESGGAGLNILRTSAWTFIMQIGAFAGYLTFGWLADRVGRRKVFCCYVLGAAALTPVYGAIPRWAGSTANAELALLCLGPFIGFLGTGFFAVFGVMLAELYPTAIRGTAQGFTYNFGRGLAALSPYLVGAVADRTGLGAAIALNSAFFLCSALLVFLLPETKEADLIGG